MTAEELDSVLKELAPKSYPHTSVFDQGVVELNDFPGEFTFEQLARLSEIFQTKRIDVKNDFCGCPTCGAYSVIELTISGVPKEVMALVGEVQKLRGGP